MSRHPYSRQIMFFITILIMSLPVFSMAGTVSLPETGQTTCYDGNGSVISCTGTGQDGDTLTGVAWPDPRFTDNGDGTITDNLTGLVWSQDANLRSGDWQAALDYVAGMNAGTYPNLGYTDWRLPNVNELESLVNAEEADSATWLGTRGFTNVQSLHYWSSTSYASRTDGAWDVSVSGGNVNRFTKTLNDHVWPVRSGSGGSFGNSDIWKTGQTTSYAAGDDGGMQAGAVWPSPRFTDNGDGTITDNLTGLLWTQDANLPVGTKTWRQALDYVAGMNAGTYPNLGYTDWRLPNRKELFSLIDRSKSAPAIQSGHPFTNVQSSNYWSSTSPSHASFTILAWIVDMYNGYVNSFNKTSSSYVWPVRSGSGGSFGNSDISVSPASHGFGNVNVGDTSTAQSFTVSNTGSADLVLGTISLIGMNAAEFSMLNDLCSGQTVVASGSCTVEAVFSPTVGADASANLSIPSNDPDTPTLDVPLSGTGVVLGDPVPDIKANGSDVPVTLSQGDNLSVTVTLDPGILDGENADWWVVVNTPFDPPSGWYYYDLNMGWTLGLLVTHQGSLFDLPSFTVLSMSGLPLGTYTFYFGVDMVMNGSLDMGSIYYDSVIVNITE